MLRPKADLYSSGEIQGIYLQWWWHTTEAETMESNRIPGFKYWLPQTLVVEYGQVITCVTQFPHFQMGIKIESIL